MKNPTKQVAIVKVFVEDVVSENKRIDQFNAFYKVELRPGESKILKFNRRINRYNQPKETLK